MEKFLKLGFKCIPPSNEKDNTYVFIKHLTGKHSIYIWLTLRKKSVSVCYKQDYKVTNPPKVILDALNDFVQELGYNSYRIEQ